MDTLLYALSGVLSVLTGIFAVIATRVFLAQRSEAKKIAQHFSYTQDAVTSISGDVKTLHAKVDTALIPKLDAVYGRLSEATRLPTTSDLLSVLQTLGYQATNAGDDKIPLVFLGITHQNIKISLFIGFNPADPLISFRSFAFSVPHLPAELLLAFLTHNASTAAASIGILELKGKSVVLADSYYPVPSGTINPQVIARLIHTLIQRQLDISAICKREGIVPSELLVNDYIDALPVDPGTERKLIFMGAAPDKTLSKTS